MSERDTEHDRMDRQRERRQYRLGIGWTVGLTLVAFLAVGTRFLDGAAARGAVAVLAIAQIVAHFRYFFHIDLYRSHRDDLMLILFTALIMTLMIGGTIWILSDQWSRMM